MVRVFAPATAANLNVGFDNLGVALKPLSGALGDEIRIEAAGKDSFSVTGPYAHEIQGANIVERALACVREIAGSLEPVSLELYKGMPVGSGLGSSAASVVASVIACDEHYGNRLGERARIKLMGELEAKLSGGIHWDNILPCALGGLRLGASRLPVPVSWIWLVAYPGIRLETRAMRAVLPESIPLHNAVEQAARLGLFVDALYRGEGQEAARLMVDPVVEPCRASFIPGFETIKAALFAAGAIASGISGSGPTIFAIFDDRKSADKGLERARQWISAVSGKPDTDSLSKLCGADKGAFACLCSVDQSGACVLPPSVSSESRRDTQPQGKE
ncbi:MAG: homoserine kinase [Spirochaetes bacterium GWB1_59_5]|nr:MAG: homoserine kinase [Spirochaetes bacterium GWB1_59_5]